MIVVQTKLKDGDELQVAREEIGLWVQRRTDFGGPLVANMGNHGVRVGLIPKISFLVLY